MRYRLQILQNHYSQNIPTLVLTSGKRNYFFNTPETLQRFLDEHSIKHSKESHFFYTQLTANHVSGLFAVLEELGRMKLNTNVKLYGPPGFSSFMLSSKYLLSRHFLNYSAYDFFTKEKILGISDTAYLNSLQKKADFFEIFNNSEEFLSKMSPEDSYKINDASTSINQDGIFQDDDCTVIPLEVYRNGKTGKAVVCYILKSKLGQKASDFKKLAQQKSNTQGDSASSEPVQTYIIADCPDLASLEKLAQAPEIKSLYKDQIDLKAEKLISIVHMAPLDVISSDHYVQWLQNFPPTTQHVFVNEQISQQNKTQSKEFKHFSVVDLMNHYFSEHAPDFKAVLEAGKACNLPKHLSEMLSRSSFDAHGKNRSTSKDAEREFYEKKLAAIKNRAKKEELYKEFYQQTIDELDSLKMSPQDERVMKFFQQCDPELIFLGTGSRNSTAVRNVSGIYLRFIEQGEFGILLDCGEGTWYQFKNHFGVEKARELLKKLKVISITHIHLDHHIGLLELLSERNKVLKAEKGPDDGDNTVYLVIPFNMAPWISRYNTLVEDLNCKIVFSGHINLKTRTSPVKEEAATENDSSTEQTAFNQANAATMKFDSYQDINQHEYVQKIEKSSFEHGIEMKEMLYKTLGISRMVTLDVKHCQDANAISIEHKDGWSLVYTGDTRPVPRFAKQIPGTTVLIHEATYNNKYFANALSNLHSTYQEAITVGMELDAWRTVLTHFSSSKFRLDQKDSQSTKLPPGFKEYERKNTVIACDHMRFRLSKLLNMPPISKFFYKLQEP